MSTTTKTASKATAKAKAKTGFSIDKVVSVAKTAAKVKTANVVGGEL